MEPLRHLLQAPAQERTTISTTMEALHHPQAPAPTPMSTTTTAAGAPPLHRLQAPALTIITTTTTSMSILILVDK